ncbi:MAG TPA: GTP pyrophosphokinase family protein [Aeromicrobium sp.]|nr:GTP pyrophosphokinase family protein [Aeromicrobium sp.]
MTNQVPMHSPDPELLTFARQMRDDLNRLTMEHQFAVDEVLTKVSILRQEFLHLNQYNPIEHVGSRVKSVQSILEKAIRRNLDLTPAAIREALTDIAGVRITCSFIADTYRILETLTAQADVKVVQIKDYIAEPKPNGYRSLHAIIEITVFLSTGEVPVRVEVQIRTIAMDFWASLEHKIYYKYAGVVPEHLAQSLLEAATSAQQLDRRMEQLHAEVHGPKLADDVPDPVWDAIDEDVLLRAWEANRRPQP